MQLLQLSGITSGGWHHLPSCGSGRGGCGPPQGPDLGGHLQGEISAAGAQRSQMCSRGNQPVSGTSVSPELMLRAEIGWEGRTGTLRGVKSEGVSWAQSAWPLLSNPHQPEHVFAGRHRPPLLVRLSLLHRTWHKPWGHTLSPRPGGCSPLPGDLGYPWGPHQQPKSFC